MADKANIGPTIRARRESANLTQSALARKLGCADTMISRWESGRATPRLKYASRLCMALGGEVADYHETK